MIDLSRSFGDLVRERREHFNATGTELSKRVGVSKAHWSDMEHGRRLPSDETAEKMRTVLAVDPVQWQLTMARERLGRDVFDTVVRFAQDIERSAIRQEIVDQQERFRSAPGATRQGASARAEALSSAIALVDARHP